MYTIIPPHICRIYVLLYPCYYPHLTVICTYRKGKQGKNKGEHTMNDKTREQIEAMKNQTIGVEIEMNNIPYSPTANTGIAAGHAETSKGGFGSFSGIRAFSDRTQRNANWSPRFLPTRTSKPCRTSSDCFARREGKVDPVAAAVSIFT